MQPTWDALRQRQMGKADIISSLMQPTWDALRQRQDECDVVKQTADATHMGCAEAKLDMQPPEEGAQ